MKHVKCRFMYFEVITSSNIKETIIVLQILSMIEQTNYVEYNYGYNNTSNIILME